MGRMRVTAPRSERTRVIANLGWLGGLTQLALGAALLAAPEAPLIGATLNLAAGTGSVLAGTLVLLGSRSSWAVAVTAFAFATGAAAYLAWVATPYWRAAAVAGGLAFCGLLAQSIERTTVRLAPRSRTAWGDR